MTKGEMVSPEVQVIRCVDWLRARGQEVNQELWDGVYEIALTAKRPSVRLKARQMLLDRIDPVSQPVPIAASAAGVTVNLAVVLPDGPDAQLQAHGLSLHLGGSNGAAAGNGHEG